MSTPPPIPQAREEAARRAWMVREILVPLDTSSLAELALPHVSALAQAFGAQVHLVSIVEGPAAGFGVADSVDWRLARDEREAYLRGVAGSLQAQGIEVDWETMGGLPAEQILETARARGSDLVVLTTHGQGGVSVFPLSGTASKVVSQVGTSVLLVRPQASAAAADRIAYKRVLAPVDCSLRGDWAVCLAARIAQAQAAELLLVSVVEAPHLLGSPQQGSKQEKLVRRLAASNRKVAREHLDELAERLDSERLRVRTRVVEEADAAKTLRRIADEEECSLLVLSAHGQSPGVWAYGTVTRGLLEHGDRPLLVFQDGRQDDRQDGRQDGRQDSRPDDRLGFLAGAAATTLYGGS